METLRSGFVRLRSHTAGFQVSNHGAVIEVIDAETEVINVPVRLLLAEREMARADA